MDTKPVYCIVTPNLGTGKPAVLDGFDALVNCISEIEAEHGAFMEIAVDQVSGSESQVEVGFSFYLENRNGGVLLAGIGKTGCVIYQMKPEPFRRL